MANKYLSLSKDFSGAIVDRWTNLSREQRIVLLGTAAILGTCWGFSKIYFWCERRKTQKRIEEEREKLRKSKEKLYQELKNDKVGEIIEQSIHIYMKSNSNKYRKKILFF